MTVWVECLFNEHADWSLCLWFEACMQWQHVYVLLLSVWRKFKSVCAAVPVFNNVRSHYRSEQGFYSSWCIWLPLVGSRISAQTNSRLDSSLGIRNNSFILRPAAEAAWDGSGVSRNESVLKASQSLQWLLLADRRAPVLLWHQQPAHKLKGLFCYSHYVSSSPAKEDGVVPSAPTLRLSSPSELHWAELQSHIKLPDLFEHNT